MRFGILWDFDSLRITVNDLLLYRLSIYLVTSLNYAIASVVILTRLTGKLYYVSDSQGALVINMLTDRLKWRPMPDKNAGI